MTRKKDTPVSELVKGLLSETDNDTVRMLFQGMLNRLLEAECTEFVQADSYERTPERCGGSSTSYPSC